MAVLSSSAAEKFSANAIIPLPLLSIIVPGQRTEEHEMAHTVHIHSAHIHSIQYIRAATVTSLLGAVGWPLVRP